jgi:VWFA-related protein
MEGQQLFRRSCIAVTIFLALTARGQTAAPTYHGMTVSVPTLVKEESGDIAYGLSGADFTIKDNGVEQRVSMDRGPDAQPISLMLVIQTGHNAKTQLAKISRLADLLDSILTNPQDQTAIVTFDSSPHLLQPFTTDQGAISSVLSSITSGNSASALFDAMNLAVLTLRKTPANSQKVIVLISGEHDHGSVGSDGGSLIQAVASTNASVYAISFRPGKTEIFAKLRTLNPFEMTSSAMQKNAGQALADLTGGDFSRFGSEREFEQRMGEVADHLHNQYSLVFQPDNPSPGLHSLTVEVPRLKVSVVSARGGYWVENNGTSGSGRGSE